MILPLAGWLRETAEYARFSAYALACQDCLCSITRLRAFRLTGELDSLGMRARAPGSH